MKNADISRLRGFTVVEILVVVSLIVLLLALLVPALGGAQRRAMKATEQNNLRQFGMAWEMYSNQSNNHILPGILPEDVQDRWQVRYKFPGDMEIEDRSLTVGYTWRLLPFLNFNHSIVAGYIFEDEDMMLRYPERIAMHPPFGYNGYYLGGAYELIDVGGSTYARPQFSNCNVVARTMNQIRHTNKQIVFSSSVEREAGVHNVNISNLEPGHYLLTPPYLPESNDNCSFSRQWWVYMTTEGALGGGGEPIESHDQIEVSATGASIPVARYTRGASVYFADGHVNTYGPNALRDRMMWVPNASDPTWPTN